MLRQTRGPRIFVGIAYMSRRKIDVRELTCLAIGRTSEIYGWDKGTVLKLFRLSRPHVLPAELCQSGALSLGDCAPSALPILVKQAQREPESRAGSP